MKHRIFRSIEEMTQPEALSALVQQPIQKTCLTSFETAGYSSTDSEFLAVGDCDSDRSRYVVKRMRRDRDWVMQATDDRYWRAIAIWQQGLLDRLPSEIDHRIIACTEDGEGYAILMHNVLHALLPDDIPIPEADHVFILDGMAALHAAFWEDSVLADPQLNLCRPEEFFTHTSPDKIRRIMETNPSPNLGLLLEGRSLLSQHLDSELAKLIQSLKNDPSPLCTALAHFPQTLVHSDVRRANLGIERGKNPKLILLDWARPIATVPAVDLVYYLMMSSSAQLPISFDDSIGVYKQSLSQRLGSRFDESWWQPQLELSILGVFSEMAIIKAYFSRHFDDAFSREQERLDLEWWTARARKGIEWLV